MHWDVCRKLVAEVEEIEVSDVKTFDVLEFSQRTLRIRTTAGETYELVLHAQEPEQLEFKTPEEHDWLSPKVYQPKAEREEEAEDNT